MDFKVRTYHQKQSEVNNVVLATLLHKAGITASYIQTHKNEIKGIYEMLPLLKDTITGD